MPPLRIVLAKPGLDGHDRGVKVVARALRDAGFEVIYLGLRQSPEQIAAAAAQEDADVVGLSILSGSHLGCARKVMERLRAQGAREIRVVIGGNIPARDVPELKSIGVDEVFPQPTALDRIVEYMSSVPPRGGPPAGGSPAKG